MDKYSDQVMPTIQVMASKAEPYSKITYVEAQEGKTSQALPRKGRNQAEFVDFQNFRALSEAFCDGFVFKFWVAQFY